MAKGFIFRHQHGGFDIERIYANPITDAQLEALGKRADSIHGDGWSMQKEIEIIDSDEVPEFETEARTGAPGDGASKPPEMIGFGFGSVEVL